MSGEFKKKFNMIFDLADSKKDGFIDKDEYLYAMRSIFKIQEENYCDDDLLDIFDYVDGRGLKNKKDEKLNKNEFGKIIKRITSTSSDGKKGISELIYRFIDHEQKGRIGAKEIKYYYEQIGSKQIRSEKIKNFMDNKERKNIELEREEFVKWYANDF